VYDLIQQQLSTLDAFLTEAKTTFEVTDNPAELKPIIVKVLIAFIKICGIATSYSKANKFARSSSSPVTKLIDTSYREQLEITRSK